MKDRFDLVLRRGSCITPGGIIETDVGIRNGVLEAFGDLSRTDATEMIDCSALHVLPGVIDSQVHFREPGLEHKEDLATGTAAAALGGVTAVFEMPNTQPPTVGALDIEDKCRRAKDRAWVDIAFFVGATPENASELGTLEKMPGCAGVKMFMGSSTGTLLVPDDVSVAQVLSNGARRIACHCEDEELLKQRFGIVEGGAPVTKHPDWRDEETSFRATKRLLALAAEAKRRVHVLHVTTKDELALLEKFRAIATVEVTPQHLTLVGPDCYRELGNLAQMNPPIRDKQHQDALWRAVRNGLVDCVGSDHAPHTIEEKSRPYPQSPSGMPGVQTLVPIMLDHVAHGRLSLERFVDLTSIGPARIFGAVNLGRIALGYTASLTVVDLRARRTIENKLMASRCGWTPYDGKSVTGWPIMTIVGGRIVMRDDELIGPPSGQFVRFLECL